MTYTKKEFLNDVAKEAIALKEHAKTSELHKLEFKDFDPQAPSSCIYGQMTGDCRTERASELILKCCTRYFEFKETDSLDVSGMKGINNHVNGSAIDGVRRPSDLYYKRAVDISYFSSIEIYIMTPFAKNKNLISFLKGEREDLKL